MAFDVTGLTAYIEENKADLIEKAILGGKTLGLGIDIRDNIKSSEKIPLLDTTVPFQSASSCGFTTSGTTTISQITLSTSPIAVAEQLCIKDLDAYFTQKWTPNNQNKDTLVIAQDVINRKLAHIARRVEQMIWQGKTTYTNDTVLKQINGWLAAIIADGTAAAATAQASIAAATVRGIFEDIYAKVPAAAIWNEPIIAFCGMDTYRILIAKLATDNLYHYPIEAKDTDNWEIVYPGTNMRVIAVPGLNNDNPVDTGVLPTAVKNRIIATYASNLLFGTAMEADISNMEMWFSQDDRVLKFYLEFRAGVNCKFFDHIVQYTNT